MGREYIERTKQHIKQGHLDTNGSELSVFHHLLTSNIPETEKSTSRLQAEAMVILIAGTFTSAHTLSMIVYHVLFDKSVEKRLREDLRVTMSRYPTRKPRLADLEKISYLRACIKEALLYVCCNMGSFKKRTCGPYSGPLIEANLAPLKVVRSCGESAAVFTRRGTSV